MPTPQDPRAAKPSARGMNDASDVSAGAGPMRGGAESASPSSPNPQASTLWQDFDDKKRDDDQDGARDINADAGGVFDGLGEFSFEEEGLGHDGPDDVDVQYGDDPVSLAKMDYILDGVQVPSDFDDPPSNSEVWHVDSLTEPYDPSAYSSLFLDDVPPENATKPVPSSPPKRSRFPPLRAQAGNSVHPKDSKVPALQVPMVQHDPAQTSRVPSQSRPSSPKQSLDSGSLDVAKVPSTNSAAAQVTLHSARAHESGEPEPRASEATRPLILTAEPAIPTRDADLSSLIRRLEQVVCSLDDSARICLRDALLSLSSKASNPQIPPTPEQEAMNRAAEYLVLRMLFLSGPQAICAQQPDVLVGCASTPMAPDEAPVPVPGYRPSLPSPRSPALVKTADGVGERAKGGTWLAQGEDGAHSSSLPK